MLLQPVLDVLIRHQEDLRRGLEESVRELLQQLVQVLNQLGLGQLEVLLGVVLLARVALCENAARLLLHEIKPERLLVGLLT